MHLVFTAPGFGTPTWNMKLRADSHHQPEHCKDSHQGVQTSTHSAFPPATTMSGGSGADLEGVVSCQGWCRQSGDLSQAFTQTILRSLGCYVKLGLYWASGPWFDTLNPLACATGPYSTPEAPKMYPNGVIPHCPGAPASMFSLGFDHFRSPSAFRALILSSSGPCDTVEKL